MIDRAYEPPLVIFQDQLDLKEWGAGQEKMVPKVYKDTQVNKDIHHRDGKVREVTLVKREISEGEDGREH